ncbi:MAG: NUDIX hydrolase [Anaerolineae bacterium]|nr:NUDIX hydrolase [Anaerolineae bacterium]
MVLLRPEDARVWVMTKSSFPIGLYSLPTGGIRPGEGIWAALARELQEETGFPLQVRRFLALIRYLPQASETGFTDLPGFVSYVFLLDAPRGVAPVLSCDEAILDFKAVGGENLVTLAQHWRRLSGKNEAFHDLAAWGLFRSVAHELVGNWLLGDGRRHG